jgi:hypothetical protein
MKNSTIRTVLGICITVILLAVNIDAQQQGFNGLQMGMGNIYRLSSAKTRSISPENLTGEKGKGGMAVEGTGKNAARDLGQKWKVSPSVRIQSREEFTMAKIDGPGAIQHIWMTPTGNWRFSIIRFYWDGEEKPSIEAPVGDFFAMGWSKYAQINSLAVTVNPGSAFNSYWPMPFRKSCRITMENIDVNAMTLYYQVDYMLTEIPADAAYLHSQFRRSNPLPDKTDHVLLEGVKGQGQYVGTYIAWGSHNSGWWGEGEIKFFMDGDGEFPTICGTGTEDYFCGSYDFDHPDTKRYQEFSGPYTGLAQVLRGDGQYQSQQRFGMYRWHIMDPIRFDKDLKVTIQALGWKSGGRYLPLRDDIASTAFWYQTEPHAAFPKLPSKDELEIN